MTDSDLKNMKDKIDFIHNFFVERNDESPTILKTENIELTADEMLFLNTYAASKPLDDEDEATLDLLKMIKSFLKVENVSILLLDNKKESLETRYSVGSNSETLINKTLSLDSGVVRMAVQTIDLQSSNKADDYMNKYWGKEIDSYLVCPMEEKGSIIGVLLFINRKESPKFTNEEITYITQAENVLSKYYYFYETQNLFVTTLKKRNDVGELKDISRSEISYLLADISEIIIKLYKKDPHSINMISDHLHSLHKLLGSYV